MKSNANIWKSRYKEGETCIKIINNNKNLILTQKRRERARDDLLIKRQALKGPLYGLEHLLSSLCYEQLDVSLLRDANCYTCLFFFPEQ